ncbi:MAG: TolB family protein, partial [Planctomycetota bacterium]
MTFPTPLRLPRLLLASLALLPACQQEKAPETTASSSEATTPAFEIRAGKPVDPLPGEKHFRNVRQLTFGGENAEAYWSFDGTKLVFQRTLPPEIPADQIFVMDLATGEERMISTGKGRTTCAYFLKGDDRIVFASTHLAADEPPPAVRVIEGKYVWPIFETYEIFTVGVDGSDLKRITEVEGYDAEATVDPVTGRLVFTSMRDGELEVYT